MGDSVIEEVAAWFAARGFRLEVSKEDAVWWGSLTPERNAGLVIARYGSGDTPEAAALRTRERYEQEQ